MTPMFATGSRCWHAFCALFRCMATRPRPLFERQNGLPTGSDASSEDVPETPGQGAEPPVDGPVFALRRGPTMPSLRSSSRDTPPENVRLHGDQSDPCCAFTDGILPDGPGRDGAPSCPCGCHYTAQVHADYLADVVVHGRPVDPAIDAWANTYEQLTRVVPPAELPSAADIALARDRADPFSARNRGTATYWHSVACDCGCRTWPRN